jgi:predicted transcriptional regulator
MTDTSRVSDDDTPAERLDGNERAVLLLLFEDRSPWTLDELGRELRCRSDAADATSALVRAGLVHRAGEFIFPTRAARRSDELYGGAL